MVKRDKEQHSSKRGKIIILSASSGAGKTTLQHALFDYFKDKHPLQRVITYTTRLPRLGEVDGVDYYFLSKERFQQKIKDGFFMEWSCGYDNFYGSPLSVLKDCDRGISSLLVLDREGVKQLQALCPEVIVPLWIFIEQRDLENRLRKRGSETEDSFNTRMQLAKQEREQEVLDPIFLYHVQNDDFDQALSCLIQIITQELEIIQ